MSGTFEVTLDPVSQEGRLSVFAQTDNIIELPETFSAILLTPNVSGVVVIEPNNIKVTILDATSATIMFSSPMVGVTEGDTVTLELLLSAKVAVGVSFSINITTIPGSAEGVWRGEGEGDCMGVTIFHNLVQKWWIISLRPTPSTSWGQT